MEQLSGFIADNYVAAGLLALLGVFGALVAHGLTGRKAILKRATVQYGVIAVMVLCTPFLLWALTSKPN